MKRLFSFLLPFFLLVACSPGSVPPPKTADVYFQEGESFFEQGLYEDAIASWEKVRDTYYSPELNVLAELKIAEAHFRAEHYIEAAAAYEEFLKQHPGHEKTPEVLHQLGMSYFNQMLSADRDQTATRNAVSTFESLRKLYPDDARALAAKSLIDQARGRLAEHELYVGGFYLKYGKPDAAIQRLQRIFSSYPDFPEKDRAYFLLGQAHLQAGQKKEATEAFNTLYREFPNSEFIPKAQKILADKY